MSLRLPPAIVQKVLRFKSQRYEADGSVTLWTIPVYLLSLSVQVYMDKLFEKEMGKEELKRILYNMGKTQATMGFRIINERFGYAKNVAEKKSLLEFNTGQTELIGLGSWKFIRMDFKKNIFIVKGESPYAKEYRRYFGVQKESVDYFFAGTCAGAVEHTIEVPMLAIETKCIGKGDKYCEMIIKPLKDWDPQDSVLKSNKILLKKAPTMQELGAKMKPYIQLPKK